MRLMGHYVVPSISIMEVPKGKEWKKVSEIMAKNFATMGKEMDI
jgi:hypothetical protein